MTAVRLRDALAYGVRFYGYLLVATLVGGSMLALGVSVLRPQLAALAVGGALDTTTAVSGGLLAFLGLSLLVACYAGAAYKLVADAVSVGQRRGDAVSSGTDVASDVPASPSGESSDASAGDSADVSPPWQAPSVDPDATGASEREPASTDGAGVTNESPAGVAHDEPAGEATDEENTVQAAESTLQAAEPDTDRRADDPPEPTPEEIAFGSSESDGPSAAEDDWVSEMEGGFDESADLGDGTAGDSVTPAGHDAGGDPLADPLDDE